MKKSNPIRAERELILHTELANRMFDGRPRCDRHSRDKCRIAGLRLFASRARTTWYDARDGNPFAHWWLIQLEHALRETEKELGVIDRARRFTLPLPRVLYRVYRGGGRAVRSRA